MQCVKYPDISAKVCSSSSVIPLYFSCSLTSSSSNLSTSFCSFITDFSANSARASACFSLAVSVLICSLYVFSRVLAFSSATSKDLRLLATTLSSSSSSKILVSPVSVLHKLHQLLRPCLLHLSVLFQGQQFFYHLQEPCSQRPSWHAQSHQLLFQPYQVLC